MTGPVPAPGGGDGGRRLAVVAVLVVVVVGAYFGARALADWVGGLGGISDVTAPPDVQPGIPVDVEVPPGSSARQIGVTLAEAGVVSSAAQFELAVRSEGVADRLQAGLYELETGMSNQTVIDLMLQGPEVENFRVTVREGLWIEELLASLAEQSDFTADQFAVALTGGQVSSRLLENGGSDLVAWEGLLFPDTYDFGLDADPAAILQRLADTMMQRVDAVDWSALEEMGLSVYEGIIIASMIEAEARVDADRPLVASVIVNRLERGMRLEIDATVIYALQERGVQLTQSQLQIDSPYNTRVVGGLPPTPIGSPGRASLEAAAAPSDTDYLYYVLTSTTGEHSFTTSYDEFLQLKRQAREDGIIP